MKPLKLTMQAFEAYPNKVEINFENLGNGNIYLISGVTGSGKTAIFDAICYALFNTSSGENRGNAVLRSHYAQDEIESFVELSFLFNGEKYRVLRHPTYQRKKSRGDGFIQEQARAELHLPNGKIIEKVKDVDEYIENLLGLNVSQFSQIALLAQGEFLKLLNADTQNRAEVFRNIFKTWNFANFQNKLKDKMIFYKNEYENLKNSILQYILDISTNLDELNLLKEKYANNACFDDLKDLILLLKKQNEIDENSLNLIKNNVLAYENEIKLLQDVFSKIQNKIQLLKQKEELEKNLKDIKKNFSAIEADFKTLDEKKKNLEELSNEIQKINKDYEKINEIKQLEKEKNNIEQSLILEKNNQQNLLDELLIFKKDYLKFTCNELILLEDDLLENQEKFIKFQKEVEDLTNNYLKNYNNYLKQQAGILAKDLKNNSPCPVCGSLKHPNLAILLDENLDKNYIDNLKKEADKKTHKLNELAKNCSILKETAKIKRETFLKLQKQFDTEIKKEKYDVLKIDFEEKISKTEKELKSKNDFVSNLTLNLKEKEAKIQTLSKDIKNSTDEIIEHHKFLQKSYNNLKSEITKIENTYFETSISLTNNESKIEVLSQQLNSLESICTSKIGEISDKIKHLEAEILKLDKDSKETLIRKSINDKILTSIIAKNKEYLEISKQYCDYKILCDCANGNLKGSAKIPFEQYIQGYYLDMVLFEANKRLRIMTQNQFQLMRKKDTTSLQGKTGLDLEVMDFHTFKKRSTKTLSGGESFKAALALALGLCDCISNFSGATNIESMFIDEGFGSLDSESLELAMEVIFSLSNENRLVGIISHIEDLKSKIQNQIHTIKTDLGSMIEVSF